MALMTKPKLIESPQDRWRAVNELEIVALVGARATFANGKLTERAEVGAGQRHD